MSDSDIKKINTEKKVYESVDAEYMRQALEREETLLAQLNEME